MNAKPGSRVMNCKDPDRTESRISPFERRKVLVIKLLNNLYLGISEERTGSSQCVRRKAGEASTR